MKKIISLLLLTLLFSGCVSNHNSSLENSEPETNLDTNSSVKTYRQITMKEAVDIMEQESNYIILDVRRPDEFSEGHIPNAINVPNENIGNTEISELPNKEQLILVYCRSGRRSKEASQKLVKLGYTNIVEFGGIIDWKGEIVS
jgi:rhodanese-related sulfurtransferase